MTIKYPDLPRGAPRPLDVVNKAIAANVAAQAEALQKGESVAELREKQKLLFIERDRARFVARGIAPQIVRGG